MTNTPSPATDEFAPLPERADYSDGETQEFTASQLRAYATAERNRVRAASQAKIDQLMLEFCPERMTLEQVKVWGDSQRRVTDEELAALARPAAEQSKVFELAAQACDQQADGTNGPYRSACLACANALRAMRDTAPGAEHIRAEQVQAQPVAEKWAVYYDNLGEQPYTSGWCKPFKLYDSESQALADYQSGTITPAKHYSACKVIVYTAPVQQGQAVAEGYVLALQTVVTMPDGKNELGHTLLDGVGIFNSECEVHEAIAELSLPLGWVSMKTSQLLPGWMLPSHPSTQPAAQSGEARDAARLEFIENCTVDLRCHDAPTPGGDDADVFWTVIEHHMAEPHEREIGWGSTAREAIDAAMSQQPADGGLQ